MSQKIVVIQLIYMPTTKNTADALTKPFSQQKFLEHWSLRVRESAAWGGVRVDKPPVSGSGGSTPGGVGRAGVTVSARA